jgi:3-methyladenine DNA glycosylase AlkD
MTAAKVLARLTALGDPAVAASMQRYFKNGNAGGIAKDVFVGVSAPSLHQLTREFQALAIEELDRLLVSPVREARALALLVLVRQFGRAAEDKKKQIFQFYLSRTKSINNWDLVDSSAGPIVGGWLLERHRQPLYRLVRSRNLWERRIAIVATQTFIRAGDFADTLGLAALLLDDAEDLIHKAAGWMLREVGTRDRDVLEEFLSEHYRRMPRTMLRYAIEKFPEQRRQQYLRGEA